MLVSSLSVVRKHLSLVEGFIEVDIEALKKKETILNYSLVELEAKESSPKLTIIRSKLATLNIELVDYQIDLGVIKGSAGVLKNQVELLSSGICPTCTQKVDNNSLNLDKELQGYRDKYKVIQTKVSKLDEEVRKLSTELNHELLDIREAKKELLSQINTVHTKVLLGEDNNKKYDAARDNITSLEDEHKMLEDEAPKIDEDLRVLDALLLVLKSGAVVNEYLKKYRLLFIRNFRALKKYTSFDIDIQIKVEKGKMSYLFFDAGKEKSFSSLSAGERTRVALMLLLATLKTIEQLTNITINYLVLDELLGVLDSEGISFLQKVLDDMRTTKSIYIITHHNEIPKEYADGVIKVVRENNLSTIEGK